MRIKRSSLIKERNRYPLVSMIGGNLGLLKKRRKRGGG